MPEQTHRERAAELLAEVDARVAKDAYPPAPAYLVNRALAHATLAVADELNQLRTA